MFPAAVTPLTLKTTLRIRPINTFPKGSFMQSRKFLKQAILPLALTAATIAAPLAATAQSHTTASSAAPAKLPAPNPANFTAVAPTRATVEAFLKASWGYDPEREWQIWAIEKTSAPGVSRVVVEVAQKNDPRHQIGTASFLVTPDGKHLIAGNLDILDFGAHPYAANRAVLEQQADGPSRGAASKRDEIVEFADFECPHCKAAEPIVERLVSDFPQAHFVFENFPLVSIHSEAFKAAAYSECVAQQSGNAAFFKFADQVFQNQQGLTPDASDATLGDDATKVGLSAAKVGACSYTDAAKNAVNASVKLAKELNVDETPTIFVNGRLIAIGNFANGQLPYDTLKEIVAYQFKMDSSLQ